MESNEHIEVYQLQSNSIPFGDEVYITIIVEKEEAPVFDAQIVSMIPKESMKMNPSEVKKLNVSFRNTGNVSWPSTTALYQLKNWNSPIFVDGKTS